jgi:hypothetical protein
MCLALFSSSISGCLRTSVTLLLCFYTYRFRILHPLIASNTKIGTAGIKEQPSVTFCMQRLHHFDTRRSPRRLTHCEHGTTKNNTASLLQARKYWCGSKYKPEISVKHGTKTTCARKLQRGYRSNKEIILNCWRIKLGLSVAAIRIEEVRMIMKLGRD